MTLTTAVVWTDLLASLILAVVGAAVAVFFPWLQTYWRGRKFQRIIKRELEELGPYPADPERNTPWWEHLRKRFVHEEIFARREISANRDFLLSLNPDVVYNVSQLWTAFEKRDADQWLHYLDALAHDARVGSAKLRGAREAWRKLLDAEGTSDTALSAREDPQAENANLSQARLASYASLLRLTRYGAEGRPFSLSVDERAAARDELMDWFYAGGGLLLSSDAFVAFRAAHAQLTATDATDTDRWRAFSALRTELKIDLGVRHADVRNVPMASLPPPA